MSNNNIIKHYIVPKSLVEHEVIKIISNYENIEPNDYIESKDNIIMLQNISSDDAGFIEIIDTFRIENYNNYESNWFREYKKDWKIKLDTLLKELNTQGCSRIQLHSIKDKLKDYIQDSKIKFAILKNHFDERYISSSGFRAYSNGDVLDNSSIGYKGAIKYFSQQLNHYNLEQLYNKYNILGINSWFSLAKTNINESKLSNEYNNNNSNNNNNNNTSTTLLNPNLLFDGYADSLSYFSQNNHILCFPNNNNNEKDNSNIGFDSNSFNQILLELINGIYNHNSLPIFSLQLNDNSSNIESVIHPIYRDTLVGKVLLALNYYLKGFLSGGFISSDYISNFGIDIQQKEENDNEYDELKRIRELKRNMIDIKQEIENGDWKYLKDKISYKSLRERSFELGLEGDDNLVDIELVLRNLSNLMVESNNGDNQIQQQSIKALNKALENLKYSNGNRFKTTFKIIAKENSCEMKDGIWISDGEFKVEYQIETSAVYQDYIDGYKCVFNGQIPKDFQLLEQLYRDVSESISSQLTLLPPCKKYFQMFKQISFLSSYLVTLKSLNQIPNIHQIKESLTQIVSFKTPLIIPPLPIRYYKTIPISITVDDVLNFIKLNNIANDNNSSNNNEDNISEINQLCTSVYKEFNIHFQQISNLNNNHNNNINNNNLKNNIINKLNKIIHKMIEIKYEGSIKYNSISQQLEILSSTFLNLLEVHIVQVIFQQYSILINTMSGFLKMLDDESNNSSGSNNISIKKATDKEFGSIPWPSSNDIFNEEELKLISSNLQNDQEELNKILAKKFENFSKFYDECNLLNISLDDLRNSSIQIIDYCKVLLFRKACNGSCNGDINRHSYEMQKINSSCRIESIRILKDIFGQAKEQLEEKKRNENWFSSFFSSTKSQISYVDNTLSNLQDSSVDKLSNVVLEYLEGAFSKTNSDNETFKNMINDIFKSNLTFAGITESLFNLLNGDSTNIIQWLTQNRTSIIQSKLLEDLGNNSNDSSTISNYLDNSILPISKLEISKKSNDIQKVWSSSCVFDIQSPLKLESVFKRKSISIEFIKNQFESQFNKWMKLDNQNLIGIKINILSLDSIKSLDIANLSNSTSSSSFSIISSFYQYIDDEELFLNYITGIEEKSKEGQLNLWECDRYGNNILHLSASVGNIFILKSMLSRIGINHLNDKNDFGFTPLLCAVIMGQVELVKFLLSSEYQDTLNINCKCNCGFTALTISILEGYSEISRLLINHISSKIKLELNNNDDDFDGNNRVIHLALESNQVELAIELVEKGITSPFIKREFDGMNSFELAVSLGQLKFAQYLFNNLKDQLFKSVNENLKEFQNSPIHIAAQNGSLFICDWLINNGFPGISIQNCYGNTPLILALENGYPEIANLILNFEPINSNFRQLSSSSSSLNSFDQTTIYQCTNKEYGSFTNCKNQTSAMISISRGYIDIAWFIINQGNESWDFIDQNGYKLLDYIILFGEFLLLDKVLSSELLPFPISNNDQLQKLLVPSSKMSPSTSYLEFALKQKNNELVNVILKYFDIDYIFYEIFVKLFQKEQRSPNQPYSIIQLSVRSNYIRLVSKWINKIDLCLTSFPSNEFPFTPLEVIKQLDLCIGNSSNSKSQSLLSIAAENGSLESLELLLNSKLYKLAIEMNGGNINSILCPNGDKHLLYYALISRNKKIIEYLVKSPYYIDQLNIDLSPSNSDSISDINVISILLSTHQHNLLEFFSSHGLKIYQFGINSINEAIKVDNFESIEYFIQKANIELIQSKLDPIGDTFYFNLWLRSILNNSKLILQSFNQQIISSLLNIKLKLNNQSSSISSSIEYQLFKSIGEPLLIASITNKDLEKVQSLLQYLPNGFINIDEIINTFEGVIINDDSEMLIILYQYLNNSISNNNNIIKDIQEIIFNYCIKYKSTNCLESMYKETNETELLNELNAIKDPKLIQENEILLNIIFDALQKKKDLVVLKLLKSSSSINECLPSLLIKDIPILMLTFIFTCEKSFEYCLSKGCNIFDKRSNGNNRNNNNNNNFTNLTSIEEKEEKEELNEKHHNQQQQQQQQQSNLLLYLAKDYTELGKQLLLLKKYLNQDTIDKLFNQEIDTISNSSMKLTHWDLLITIMEPNYIQEAYNESLDNSEEELLIEFANSFGLSLKEKQGKDDNDEGNIINQVIEGISGLSTSESKIIPNQRYSKNPNNLINNNNYIPKFFSLPNREIDTNLLLIASNAGKSNWLNEWYNIKLINKLEFDQINRYPNKLSITYLEKRYHYYNRMIQIINQCDPLRLTPLMYASASGNIDCVKVLIENGVDPTYYDNKGNSAIFYAVNSNFDSIIWYLLPYSLSVINHPTSNNDYLISLAAEKGLLSLVSRLLNYGSYIDSNGNFNKLALSKSCFFSKSNIIKKLLSIKRLLSSPVSTLSTPSTSSTLNSGLSSTNKDISKMNNNNSEENSIINYSISQITSLTTSLPTFKLLFDEIGLEDSSGSNIYKIENPIDFGNTSFEIAIQNNNLTMIEYILSFSQNQQSDLWVKVVISDNPRLIELLSSPNELLSNLPSLKVNALHIAALRKCHKIVPSLIKIGVSPFETCLYENTTPLQLASSLGNCQFIKSLLNSLKGDKLKQVLISSGHSSGGKSALELALFNGHLASAYLLIQVTPNLSIYKLSLKLLNYIASNPNSQNNWSNQELLFKLLAIYGDNSISSINLNLNHDQFTSTPTLNEIISTFYSSNKFKLLQNQIDSLDFSGDYLSFENKLKRSLALGFTLNESKELLSTNWLNSNSINDIIISPNDIDSSLSNYLHNLFNNNHNIRDNESSKLFLNLVLSKFNSTSQMNIASFIYEYLNGSFKKEDINGLLDEAYYSLSQIQDNKTLISMFDKEIASKWVWKFMFSSGDSNLFKILNRVLKLKNNQIYYWFISHFTSPIKSLFVDSKVNLVLESFKRFEEFIGIFEDSEGLIPFLPYPPTDIQLSYQNENGRRNMQLAIDSIKKQSQLRSIQISFLQYLPKSTEYIELSLKNSLSDTLLVCRQSFELSSILLKNNNNQDMVLDLISTCSLSLLKVFRGLRNQNSIDQVLKSRFILNYQTNLRILEMMNQTIVSTLCKIELINYFNFILEMNQYNIITSGDKLSLEIKSSSIGSGSGRIDWCRDMQTIIAQTSQIIKYLGEWYFNSFLNIILNYQKSINNSSGYGGGYSLRSYIDITQKLLSLTSIISVNQIWNISKYSELELLVKKVLDNEIKNKINQIPFKQVWEYFKSPLNNQPLNDNDLNTVQDMYLQFESIQDKFKDMTKQSLIEFTLNISRKLIQEINNNKLNPHQQQIILNNNKNSGIYEIDQDEDIENICNNYYQDKNNNKEELIIITNKTKKLTIKLLSSLCWLIYYEFGIFPYSTQVCCVLGLILYNNSSNSDDYKLNGRISQVLTGEGKSTIVALLASYCSLLNRKIDIITTSEYLAFRDYIKFESFFKLFNITSSHICGDQPNVQQFQAQILFGTNTNFEFAQLRDNLYDTKNLYESDGITVREKDIVIVDEVDSLFMDSALNSARMAISTNDSHDFMYKPISNYVYSNFISRLNDKQLSKLSNIMYDDDNSYKDDYLLLDNEFFTITPQHFQDIRDILTKLVESLPSSIDQKTKESLSINWLNNLNDRNIKLIIDNAIKSFILKEGFDYVIIQNDDQQQSKSIVVIVDKSNTGRLMIGSRFSDGLHEFLEVKHGLLPEQETLTAAAISHPSFFSQYNCVFGLTGTCGEQSEREELMKVYNVDSFNVPSYNPPKRIQLESMLFKTNQEHQDYIINEIKEYSINQSRPVLLLLPTIKESQQFINILQNNHNIQPQLLNEMQQEDEEFIITRAGEPGIVTVATNTAGRGTDIKLTNQSIKNGGLHVIFGFYPKNSRVENQGLGRSGRQGQIGTCRIIISLETLDLNLFNYESNNQSDNNSYDHDIKEQFKLLDLKRSEKCQNLSNLRLAQCIIEKEQFKLLDRYFNLLSKIRNYLKSDQFLDLLNEILTQQYQDDEEIIISVKCNCNNQQFSTFLNSSLFLNLLDSCSKLISTISKSPLTPVTVCNNSSISNYNNLQSLADRIKQSIIDFIQQEWAQFFTFNFSSRSQVPLIQFNNWWFNISFSHCLELNIDSHFKKLIYELYKINKNK